MSILLARNLLRNDPYINPTGETGVSTANASTASTGTNANNGATRQGGLRHRRRQQRPRRRHPNNPERPLPPLPPEAEATPDPSAEDKVMWPRLQLFFLVVPPLLAILSPFLFPIYTVARINANAVPHNSRVGFLIAHPDDEAMFFTPTLLELAKPEKNNAISILCLSEGNATGLGHIRRREFHAAPKHLSLDPLRLQLHLINDPALFPDDMRAHWDPRAIASTLRNTYLTPDNTLDLDVLITFDQHGVSAHRNHVSLYHGAVEFVRGLLADATAGTDGVVETAGAGALPRLYTLTTTGIFRKYIALLDIIPTRYFARKELKASEAKEKKLALLKEHLQKKGQPVQVESHDPGILRPGDRFVFQNNILGYRRARAAMTRAYESQMVWFRHGWILLGRYMYVNDLKRVDVTRST